MPHRPAAQRRAGLLALTLLLLPSIGRAQRFTLIGGNVQKRANAVLTLMGYSVVPDASASSLSIRQSSTDDPGLTSTQFGYGFELSERFPLCLEGFAGYSVYDPKFVLAMPIAHRGHGATVALMADDLYAQLHRQGAFGAPSGSAPTSP